MNKPLIERREAPAFSVGVVLEQTFRIIAAGKGAQLKVPIWSLRELVLRGQLDTAAPLDRHKTVIHESDSGCHVLWTGYALKFFRDGGESYWHTLIGDQQELFVVCQDDENDVFTPILVTADYDEAMAYQEADDTIFSTPMPEKIYHVLERFVLENYAPVGKKRRKRQEWHSKENDETFVRKPTAQ